MIDKLFDFFERLVEEEASESTSEDTIALAAAALMLEVARSDADKKDIELGTISQILQESFSVDAEFVSELMKSAAEQVEAAHDLYQFTQLINEHYSYEDKERLLLAMWQVAYADGHVEAIEDHIIRRVAGLIHLAHADFIRLKIQARGN